jgi:hypothetical protein
MDAGIGKGEMPRMSTKGKLIVLAAFVKNEEGELVPAFDPLR